MEKIAESCEKYEENFGDKNNSICLTIKDEINLSIRLKIKYDGKNVHFVTRLHNFIPSKEKKELTSSSTSEQSEANVSQKNLTCCKDNITKISQKPACKCHSEGFTVMDNQKAPSYRESVVESSIPSNFKQDCPKKLVSDSKKIKVKEDLQSLNQPFSKNFIYSPDLLPQDRKCIPHSSSRNHKVQLREETIRNMGIFSQSNRSEGRESSGYVSGEDLSCPEQSKLGSGFRKKILPRIPRKYEKFKRDLDKLIKRNRHRASSFKESEFEPSIPSHFKQECPNKPSLDSKPIEAKTNLQNLNKPYSKNLIHSPDLFPQDQECIPSSDPRNQEIKFSHSIPVKEYEFERNLKPNIQERRDSSDDDYVCKTTITQTLKKYPPGDYDPFLLIEMLKCFSNCIQQIIPMVQQQNDKPKSNIEAEIDREFKLPQSENAGKENNYEPYYTSNSEISFTAPSLALFSDSDDSADFDNYYTSNSEISFTAPSLLLLTDISDLSNLVDYDF